MLILGVHGGLHNAAEDDPGGFALHDSAAVLIRSERVIAAVEEERIARIKHTNTFPLSAIRRCLQLGHVRAQDIDCVALNSGDSYVQLGDQMSALRNPNLPPGGSNALFKTAISEALDGHQPDLAYCDHHAAHAWSAYIPSDFSESLVLSLDGDGDGHSGMVFTGSGRSIQQIHAYPLSQSLGHFYEGLIAVLGYQRFDEYKAMGLAPYGQQQTYRSVFERLYDLSSGGQFALADRAIWLTELSGAGLLERVRRPGEPFSQAHKDFAAALQAALERIVLHVLKHFRRTTANRHLCLAGGVAHNCSLNGRILASGIFDRVYVQPAAHDSGGALGAAWSALYTRSRRTKRARLPHVYLGTDIGSLEEIKVALTAWEPLIRFRLSDCVSTEAAQLIADGAVIGWVQGRAEFGPRALGHRSILADPRPASNKDRINDLVKKREHFRPFAPSVLEERVSRYFEGARQGQRAFPFMVMVLTVKEQYRQTLGAVTHVDGSARVQTVSRRSNSKLWALIRRFEELTGIPAVLNTSFNNHAEPIVDSVNDAITCFVTSEIDWLVVGDFICAKASRAPAECLPSLVAELPPSKKLVKRARPYGSGMIHAIESTKSRFFAPEKPVISLDMFELLLLSDGQTMVGDLADRMVLSGAGRSSLYEELWRLWQSRSVTLRPAAGSR